MKRAVILPMISLLIMALALSACGLLQEPEKAGGPIEAIPLETQPAGAITQPGDPATGAGSATVFTLDPSGSEVRFQLDEDLRGLRNTVVGTTNQVAGQLSVDLADLSQAQVGVIQINARTLTTDSSMRNRTMQNQILDAGTYEFITFTPTGIQGLPASATVGESISFTIVGDLTIRDITQPVTFDVQATAVSDRQITGTAAAVVNRTDFGLGIPSVPGVANVDEQVQLSITFIANAS